MSALAESLIIRIAMVSVRSPRVLALLAMWMAAGGACANENESSSAEHQSLDDAWWTGPIVTAGAGTLPQGHALIEPYLYDVVRYARYDADGRRQDAERVHSYGSLTYLLYGVTDKFTAGLIPIFGFNDVSNGPDSSAIQVGDLAIQGQYRLSQFREGSRVPTTSLVVQETLPTGKYDRLGSHPNDGFGAGAYTTMIALYSQYYFWMPNGRILRAPGAAHAFSGLIFSRIALGGTSQGGLFDHAQFEEETLKLEPGDLIVLFSDGVTEAMNAQDEEFTDDRLIACANAHRGEAPQQVLDALLADVHAFCAGEAQSDDVTAVLVRYNGT
jgi:hypothetical protein